MFGSFNLKKHMSKEIATQEAIEDEVVTVVREDGKEFKIKRDMVAFHLNRGFTVKDKEHQPTEEELRKATGYRNTRGNIATSDERPHSAANEIGAVGQDQKQGATGATAPEKTAAKKPAKKTAAKK